MNTHSEKQRTTNMFVKQYLYFLICSLLAFCKCFDVESLPKCGLKDSECQRDLYQNMIRNIGKTGLPELGIPVVDPIELKNVTVSVLDMVNLTMVEGVAKGIKNCVFNKFEIDIEKERGSETITCDITIKGHYRLSADSPLINQVLGAGSLRGEGNGKVKLEKLQMNFVFPFYPERHEDGEIYMICLYKDIQYTYDILGKASFAADNIYLGKENVSEFVIKYLNENWKFLMQTFGKIFIDKAMEFYFNFAQKFFEGVPARHYILDDLTPYLKN